MSGDDLLTALADAALAPGSDGLWLDSTSAVAAVVTDAGAFVGWLDVAWPGPGEPVRRLHGVVHVPPALAQLVGEAVGHAQALRADALRPCRYCGERNTPGRMHSADVCQGCAERHLGVVH